MPSQDNPPRKLADDLPAEPTAPDITQDQIALTLEHLGVNSRMLDTFDHAKLTWDGKGRASFPTPEELRDTWRDHVKPALDAEKQTEASEQAALSSAVESLLADRAAAGEVRTILQALVRRIS